MPPIPSILRLLLVNIIYRGDSEMGARDLINSDSEGFWKWWNSGRREAEFKPYIMEVRNSVRRREKL